MVCAEGLSRLAESRPTRIGVEELHRPALHAAIPHRAPAIVQKLDGLRGAVAGWRNLAHVQA